VKTILICGASRGIGRASALALATPQHHLTLTARSAPALAELAQAIESGGGQAQAHPADVTDEQAVRDLVDRAAAATGRLDVLIHSVGGAVVGPFEQITLDAWEAQLRIQLTSLFLLSKYAAPRMPSGGLIIHVASIAARQAIPTWSAYVAAKHGALGFASAIREELRPRGIRVTNLLPAATDTELWDSVPGEWNRANMLQPAEVAATITTLVEQPTHVQVDELTVGHVVGKL
jgi:3-oxoacyl-[acyl-carrier protein] reductase